ncbi:MAG: hypothetical protein ACFFDF_00090, partial [Candidatus Odinarchaeota archaeon]
NLDEIESFIKSRFRTGSVNINYNGIISILESLAKKNLVVEGSKYTKDDILKNQKRKTIYFYIIKNKFTYFRKIVNDLKLANHVVIWHLNMLLKFKFINKATLENHPIYFDIKIDSKDIRKDYYVTKEKSKFIINYLKVNNMGITKTQISLDLNMHFNTVAKYLKLLEKLNIIYINKVSNKKLYFLIENFRYIEHHLFSMPYSKGIKQLIQLN